MNHLYWSKLCPHGEAFHLARAHLRGAHATPMHAHNFPELFWIEEGAGTHRVNNRLVPLKTGDLVFIRETDQHALSTNHKTGLVIVNIAIPPDTLKFLRSRYFQSARRWFWNAGPEPDRVKLDGDRLARLARWVSRLDSSGRSRLEVEIFMMELLRELADAQPPGEPTSGPEWLIEALDHRTDPAILSGGTSALARRAGRTPQHLNASLRKWRGITATDAVNEIRMEVAARELRTSTKKIIEICFDCGLQNLAHFYKLFRLKFGTTPRLYRARHQAVIRS